MATTARCVPPQGPHNVSTGRDKGESVYVMENSSSSIFRTIFYIVMC